MLNEAGCAAIKKSATGNADLFRSGKLHGCNRSGQNLDLRGETDSFVSAVARNATSFLQSLPPGVFLGIVLIALIYHLFRSRLPG